MKFTIQFKDPDGVYDSLQRAAMASIPPGLSKKETDVIAEYRRAIRPWVEFGECVRIEFDTEAKTATVLKKQ